MPRTPGARRIPARRRSTTAPIVSEIMTIVTTNTHLRRANEQLTAENAQLRAQLQQIATALGSLNGGRGHGRGRARAVQIAATAAEPQPRRTRKPITDPVLLEKRRAALAKARAARSEKRAAARAVEASPA